MDNIAGIPYVEAEFDKKGKLKAPVALPGGVTDLVVVAHGWNNNAENARSMYRALFESFVAVEQPGDMAGRSLAVLGVIWPSKKFDEMVAAASASGTADGSAALHSSANTESDRLLEEKLASMETTFTDAGEQAVLDELKALIPDLEDKGSARGAFVDKVRSLLDQSAENEEDASKIFFREGGNDLMKALKVAEDDLDPTLTGDGGSASLPLGVGVVAPAAGGAAGLLGFLSGFKAAAMNILNFATYFEMKSRAGTVGKNGLGPLIDSLSSSVERIHLVGHSFGGRVVASAVANSTSNRISSLSLLQSAFSHNGFSQSKKGLFRAVVDKTRVNGPIVITHTANDKAVGMAYPLASRMSGETAAGLGDRNDKFGGLGRNGAQQMNAGEVVEGKLLPQGASYAFQNGKFFNFESSEFVSGHSAITGGEVAHLVRRAVAG